jgi:steroid delta-isomerase-like uncharacterized protein
MPQNSKAVLQEALRKWNAGDKEGYLGSYSDDVTLYGYGPVPMKLEQLKQFYAIIWSAFSDNRIELEGMIEEGDKVAARFTMTATHSGDFMGIPATGKKIAMSGITMVRVANGKIAERWSSADMLGMMQQLGAIPGQ